MSELSDAELMQRVSHGDQVLVRVPAVAQMDIAEGGIMGWIKDSVLMMFE